MEDSHYEEVPNHIQTKIIAAHKAEKGEAADEEEGIGVTGGGGWRI